jgi:hypothetical protein
MNQNNPDLTHVLEEIRAGRTKNLTCPFCKGGTLKQEQGDYGPEFVCPKCRKFIEAPIDF